MKKYKKMMLKYRNLRRTERIVWVLLLVCLFLLFQIGIDMEYALIHTLKLKIVHTITAIATLVLSVLQTEVIQEIFELERKIYDEK